MRAVCPEDKRHKTFITTAYVAQEWVVDDEGNCLETLDIVKTVDMPDSGRPWVCDICGCEANVE